jgi:hypothetical protein
VVPKPPPKLEVGLKAARLGYRRGKSRCLTLRTLVDWGPSSKTGSSNSLHGLIS